VAVVRGRDAKLRAFYNVCQHRAHELLTGTGNLKAVITCPYHAWAYDLEGKLRTARNCENVKGFDKADFTLPQVRVETLANLAEQAPNLEADLRANVPHWDALEFTNSYDFGGRPIEAGWKVVVDNYVECYHCATAHPAFADMIEIPAYENSTDGITALQIGPKIHADNSAYKLTQEDSIDRAYFWYLWPTTTINMLPGRGDVMITNVVPQGPGRTAFHNDRFAVGGEPEIPERQNYLQNILGVEDMELCESVQRGLVSKGYDQGRFMVDEARSGEGEHAAHFFHKLVLDALEG
jgi:carnitine monooxygenase subunit